MIRFGEMEFTNLSNGMDMDATKRMAMLYSFSTKGRRATGRLYTDNVLDIEKIEVPEDAKNTNVEIFNIYAKATGLRLQTYSNEIDD